MNNTDRWSDNARNLALSMAEIKTAKEISIMLALLGHGTFTEDAVRGVIRRHKEKACCYDNDVVEYASKSTTANAPRMPKILIFDIESSDLSASFGEMLCFGYQWWGAPEPKVMNIYDYPGWDKLPVEQRDKYLVQDVVKIMEEADVLVGHFSSGFDHPFIQTRCIFHGLDPIPNPIHIDTWKIAKKQLRLNNNRLKTIADTFGCDEQKSSVPTYVWRRAKAHDLEALKLISKYNLQDVRTQYSIIKKLMPLAKGMPNWNLFTDEEETRCSSCGSENIQHRGYAYTQMYKFERFSCSDCGRWMRGRNSVTSKDAQRLY